MLAVDGAVGAGDRGLDVAQCRVDPFAMPPSLLMTEVKPAAVKRGAEGAGLRSVMRRETIGLPARRRFASAVLR